MSAKRKPLTHAPDALTPEEMQRLREWMSGRYPVAFREALPDMVEACLDYFRAKGAPMADWVATARNWIRKEAEYRRPQHGPASRSPARTGVADAARSLLERYQRSH